MILQTGKQSLRASLHAADGGTQHGNADLRQNSWRLVVKQVNAEEAVGLPDRFLQMASRVLANLAGPAERLFGRKKKTSTTI